MCPVRAGQAIYEVSGVSSLNCINALKRASNKLSFKTRVFKLIY
jgi:ribosomal protein L16/L10AE